MNPDGKDHLRALLDAFNEVTGFGLPFIPAREKALRCLDKLQLTPDDVRAVMCELKRLVETDPRHYPEACLDFRNAIVDTERFDSRARRLRGRATRKAKAQSAPAPAPAVPAVDEERLRRDRKAAVEKLKREIGR